MFDDALANAEGEIQTAKGGVSLFKPGNDAQGVQVVVETQSLGAESVVERLFAGVPEWRMTDVMGQRQSFSELRVEPESVRQGAGDLRHLQRVSESATEVVARRITRQPGEYLGFAGKTAKGACVQNPRRIAGKRSSIRMGWLVKSAARKFSAFINCNSVGQHAERL